jgi:uncharacterized protein (DUF927 family)
MELTSITNAGGINPGKHFKLDASGKLVGSTVGGRRLANVSAVKVGTIDELHALAMSAQATTYWIAAATGHPQAVAMPAEKLTALLAANGGELVNEDGVPVIALTKQFLRRHSGPALMVIDSDGIAPEEAWQQIIDAAPALADVAHVRVSSSSSCIFDAAGNELRGVRGGHTYIPVSSGNDIAEALLRLHQRLWLAGHGVWKLSEAGAFLERSAVDLTMRTVTQPIFQRSTLGDGLVQRKQGHVQQGKFAPDILQLIPALTDAELTAYSRLTAEAKASLAPDASASRRGYVERVADRMVEQHQGRITVSDARRAVTVAIGNAVLSADCVVETSNGSVTVAEILRNPGQWHRVPCRDPIERDYGSPSVAMIFTNRQALIHSHAHHGRTFVLSGTRPDVDVDALLGDMDAAYDAEVAALRGDDALAAWLVDTEVKSGNDRVPSITGDDVHAQRVAAVLAVADYLDPEDCGAAVEGDGDAKTVAAELVGDDRPDTKQYRGIGLRYRIDGVVHRVALGSVSFCQLLQRLATADMDRARDVWAELAASTVREDHWSVLPKDASRILRIDVTAARDALGRAKDVQKFDILALRDRAIPSVPQHADDADGDDPDDAELAAAMGLQGVNEVAAANRAGIPYQGGSRIRKTEDGKIRITDRSNAKGEPLDDVDVVVNGDLTVAAQTRTPSGRGWGRLLEWLDADGVHHTWAMPVQMAEGDGMEVRKVLAAQGVVIGASMQAGSALMTFLKMWPVSSRVRCVTRLGWAGESFVTPDRVYGAAGAERVVYQAETSAAVADDFAIAGDIDDWRNSVAMLANGQSRLVFALSTAFAGPLLMLCDEPSGGVNYLGESSIGKTTALDAAASVFGPPGKRVKSWRATSNGLESTAAAHNDLLLILDELGQADPREVGQSVYMLANGAAKSRAGRTGAARDIATWRVLFLSSGELSLQRMMSKAGIRSEAGMDVRLLSVPADAGEGLGIFDKLPAGCTSGAQASAAVKAAARANYGAAGSAWLEYLAVNRQRIDAEVGPAVTSALASITAGRDLSGQVSRVARRFAVIAAAGEMATAAGLTGWDAGMVTISARACFEAWLETHGGADAQAEHAKALEAVVLFLSLHGQSRFAYLSDEDQRPSMGLTVSIGDRPVINQAGFRDDNNKLFLVTFEVFKSEIVKGLDPKVAIAALRKKGWLVIEDDGSATVRRRIAGQRRRFLGISFAVLAGDDDSI